MDLNNPTIDDLVKKVFLHQSLKTYQQQAINDFLSGSDLLIIAPTGSGKSLCYQIPSLMNSGTMVVVSPLIALMNEQVTNLKAKGIPAACLHSAMEKSEQQLILESLNNQSLKMLYVAPERLVQPFFLKQLQSITISGFAIDEAHCILHWGDDFRPEYEKLHVLKARFPEVPIMALTATATPDQQQRIIEKLRLNAIRHIYSAYKAHIHYHVFPSRDLTANLMSVLHKHPQQSGIIYCASRKRCERIALHLQELKLNALCYHAGLTKEQREQQQQLFLSQDDAIMVATNAFGMGIDKPNIRFVLHYDIPARFDQFIQESGRAGRDGFDANSYLMFHPELFFQFNLWHIKKSFGQKQTRLLQELKLMATITALNTCIPQHILSFFDHQHHAGCQTCDACLQPRSLELDAILMLLSCVYRMQQHAEWDVVVEVLMGIQNSKTLAFKDLSTFGIGHAQEKWYWFNVLGQAFAKEWIALHIADERAFWRLTATGSQVLKHKSFTDNVLALT